MAFYRKMKMKVNGKWYPKSVLVGSTITTEQVAKRVAAKSLVQFFITARIPLRYYANLITL